MKLTDFNDIHGGYKPADYL